MNTRKYLSHLFNKPALVIKKGLYWILRHVRNPFRSKRVLIIRLDAIGDYVLFRNNILPIRQSSRFQSYHFTLLGNKAFKDLALAFDKHGIDEFIWVHPEEVSNIKYYNWTTFKLLLRLKLKGFDIVIHPVHSRIIEVDTFIKYLGAETAIGSTGDVIGYRENDKITGDAVYNELIPVPAYNTFEFYRNLLFTRHLIHESAMDVPLHLDNRRTDADQYTVILFPGAGVERRRWPAHHFAELIRLMDQYMPGIRFCIAGGDTDIILAEEIMGYSKGILIDNYAGKTSLPELVELLKQGDLLISNETSAVHMAAAVNLPVVCISNGNHFGRFNPYPTELRDNITTLYPDPVFYDPTLFDKNVEENRFSSNFDINRITPAEVFEVTKQFLSGNK